MTRIDFFFNVADKQQKVAELSEKALKKGRKLMLFTSDATSAHTLDRYLWTHPPTGFLPHCQANQPQAAVTPILIGWENEPLIHHDLLINLHHQYPPFFSRFTRLIEIVGTDESDKIKARERYRFYRDRGYEIKSFDTSGSAL
ncbi:MAG: DNA polymerase III subunit chi [Methylophilaceae bacterium]|nr:DNA polymerase III subunit chi [Methylophilaceae bacterium]